MLAIVGFLVVISVILYYQHDAGQKDEFFSKENLKKCYEEKYTCIDITIPNIWAKYPLETVMQLMEKNLEDRDIFLMCHQYGIGRQLGFEASKKADDFKETLKKCDGYCYEACYHGVAEGFFTKIFTTDKNKATQLCGELKDHISKDTYQGCLYGIGRALMKTSENNLLESLYSCGTYKTLLGKTGCYSGVFAENVGSIKPSPYFRPNDLSYPCNIIEEGYRNTCYAFQARYYIDKNNGDFKKGVLFCKSVPNAYQNECMRHIVGHSVYTKNATELNSDCNLLTGNLKKICIESVIFYLIQRDFGKLEEVKLFCVLIPTEYHELCDLEKN